MRVTLPLPGKRCRSVTSISEAPRDNPYPGRLILLARVLGGEQVAEVARRLAEGAEPGQALVGLSHEPNLPIFTPRITAVVNRASHRAWLGAVRRPEDERESPDTTVVALGDLSPGPVLEHWLVSRARAAYLRWMLRYPGGQQVPCRRLVALPRLRRLPLGPAPKATG